MFKVKGTSRGLSLVELLVAITILSIAVIVCMGAFIQASKIDRTAEKQQAGTTIGTTIADIVRNTSKSYIDKLIANSSSDVFDLKNSMSLATAPVYSYSKSGKITTINISKIRVKNNYYSAQIILDPTNYSTFNNNVLSTALSAYDGSTAIINTLGVDFADADYVSSYTNSYDRQACNYFRETYSAVVNGISDSTLLSYVDKKIYVVMYNDGNYDNITSFIRYKYNSYYYTVKAMENQKFKSLANVFMTTSCTKGVGSGSLLIYDGYKVTDYDAATVAKYGASLSSLVDPNFSFVYQKKYTDGTSTGIDNLQDDYTVAYERAFAGCVGSIKSNVIPQVFTGTINGTANASVVLSNGIYYDAETTDRVYSVKIKVLTGNGSTNLFNTVTNNAQ